MTHGSLFSGIGGFDLGFERAGFKTIWQVEIDPYCRKVLEKHFPDAERYADIKECRNLRAVDVISGGFPCQDISNAGKRIGIDGERSGLWSEMWRVVREVRPRFVCIENVSALLGRGMGRVLGDLAEGGYDAEWDVLPASAFGAPHIRERVFIVAYSKSDLRGAPGNDRQTPPNGSNSLLAYPDTRRELQPQRSKQGKRGWTSHGGEDVAYAPSERCGGWTEEAGWQEGLFPAGSGRGDHVADANGNNGNGWGGTLQMGRSRIAEEIETDGNSARTQWSAEPDVGRVAHGVPHRVERLKGLGNAVVPQIAQWIAERIKQIV